MVFDLAKLRAENEAMIAHCRAVVAEDERRIEARRSLARAGLAMVPAGAEREALIHLTGLQPKEA